VIAIDNIPERLRLAEAAGADTINFADHDLAARLNDMTAGRGPDACVDCVGLEAHGTGPGELYDWAKMGLRLATDRPNVLRQAIQACRKGGVVSIPGVYGGLLDKIPMGAAFNKGLTFKMGQTHVHKYLQPLLQRIQNGDIDPTFIITHRVKLADAPKMYDTFKNKRDNCIKVVMTP
jgi:threonine dehydrogenase-like Zn-dependent dehydrogenase